MDLKDGWWGNDGATFSENGATIVWLGPGENQSTLPVWWSDLRSATPEAVETSILAPSNSNLAVSDDRSKVAILGDERYVSVYDLRSGDLLWMARTQATEKNARIWFSEINRLRISIRQHYEKKFPYWNSEYDAENGQVISEGAHDRWDSSPWPSMASVDNPHLPFYSNSESDRTVRFQDPNTGALIRAVTIPEWADQIRPLEDGRLFASNGFWSDPYRIALENPNTNEWKAHSLGLRWELSTWIEVLPGKIVVSARNSDSSHTDDFVRFVLLDLETGEERTIGVGPSDQPNMANDRRPLDFRSHFKQTPNRFDRFVFVDPTGALVSWDPETNETTTIAGGAG